MDGRDSGSQTGERFNLMRYFVLASLVALVGVALLSALIFGALMRYALISASWRRRRTAERSVSPAR